MKPKLTNNDEQKLYTTHNRLNSKPKFLAKSAIINGSVALIYEKNGQIDNYIPLEELNRAMYASKLQAKELDF